MRLIDADALYDDAIENMAEDEVLYGFSPSQIDRAPTIDAVPVVRCGRCGFWDEHPASRGESDGPKGKCTRLREETAFYDFCSHGEEKRKYGKPE